ncbi:Bug family tripartite tricarboxylate transporter substrate binding protein [Cloacibacillus porcorum]|uniref:Bug family tripartite tricarboxylate transporter substrate binding protein n=1 Tax=Cloacibacillus porcorum TaxID=1197717 RepID=UPI0026715649|nr:tripartite tricarboxylate transporter substrate binding protein [Cloacibacillus porcorum]
MKKVLRSLIFVLVLLTAVCAAIPVFAASFPTKPVLAVVPFSPGGGNDIVIRLVAKYMTPALGQSLVVENKPGAGGQIGWTALAKARPDGYTIGATSQPSMVLVKVLRQNVPFDLNDFKYICNFQIDPLVWVVNKDSKFKKASDVVEYAKKNPGKLNVAGDGPQSNVQLQHLVNSKALKMESNFVSYSGSGPALTALMGNQVDLALTTLSSAVSHIEAGRIVPLVMFYDDKIDGVDIKSSKEVFKMDIPSAGTAMRGVATPKNTKPEDIAVLEKAFEEVTKNPEFREQAKSLGLIIKFIGSKESGKLVEESKKIVEEYKPLF